jgi:transposase-like protein
LRSPGTVRRAEAAAPARRRRRDGDLAAAKGLTTGEITGRLADVYGAEVSKDTISRITDRVVDELAAWQTRPLDQVYPVVFNDAIHVKDS